MANILVADDEEIVTSLISECLEDEGYHIEVASNGQEAVDLLELHEFDLLITDIRMPDFDGIELLRRAKGIQPTIGAIFMTGYADVKSAKDAIKEGALDYLLKPFEIQEIRASVKNALEKRNLQLDSTATLELDRVAKLAELMNSVDDVHSLLSASLSFILLQCELECGTAVYWSEESKKLVQIFPADEDTFRSIFREIQMDTNPLDKVSKSAVETGDGCLISEKVENHPLANYLTDHEGIALSSPACKMKGDGLASFALRHGDRLFGFILIPMCASELSGLQKQFKLISMITQQTSLSMENLTLLAESRRAYQELQDLQERTISLETMAARGEMAAEIGHELKNFLGVVYGNLSLLELQMKGQSNEKFRKYFDAVVKNLEEMKRFTIELMRESSISEERETIDVGQRIKETVEFLRPQKRFAGVDLSVCLPDKEILFNVDPGLFQQLMYNILNNAADACRSQKDPRIDVAISSDFANDSVTVSVGDNGSGIEPELLEKAFKTKFTTKQDGHGFGLLVCGRIIESYAGELKISSIVGEGTTISITFPLGATEANKDLSASTQKIAIISPAS